MEIKDKVEAIRSTIIGIADNCHTKDGTQSENVAKLKDIPAFGNSHAPKVRKPYTITKQREKWTDEEHQKFLEALKLYGRGWRQIEEHIGTKTAVQIRSHAQKFFSKVVREPDGIAESSIQPNDIPPPRPKRKPLHPYPRKSVDSFKGQSIPNEPEISPSTNQSVAEKDSQSPTSVLSPSTNQSVAEKDGQSPTSVLSAFGSEAFDTALSEQTNRCLSPNSCTTEICSLSLSPVEKENDCQTSKPSKEEVKGSLASVSLATDSDPHTCMKSEISFKEEETKCFKEEATNMPDITSIKLFGRTVSMVGNQKSIKEEDENIKPITTKYNEVEDVENEKVGQAGVSEQLDTQLSLGMCSGNWHVTLDGAEVTNAEHPNENLCFSGCAPDDASLPWWYLYQGLPAFHLRPSNHQILNPMPLRPSLKVRTREDESCCTGSNTESVCDTENQSKNSDTGDSQCQKHHESVVAAQKSGRGFVPYKRCLAERDGNYLIVALEERKGQRARVCS